MGLRLFYSICFYYPSDHTMTALSGQQLTGASIDEVCKPLVEVENKLFILADIALEESDKLAYCVRDGLTLLRIHATDKCDATPGYVIYLNAYINFKLRGKQMTEDAIIVMTAFFELY
jgi:hypothetical protein